MELFEHEMVEPANLLATTAAGIGVLGLPPAAEGGHQVPRDSLAGGVEPPVAAKAADVAFKMLHNIRPLRARLPPLGCSRGPTV